MPLKFKTPLTKKENEGLKREVSKTISKRLKEIRLAKKLSQQEVAEKAGLHLTYIGHLELVTYHPSSFVLWKIAQVLNTPLDKFFS